LQRGLAPCGGKENSDPRVKKEARVSGRFRGVSEKEKGFEGRGLAAGALTPRLKRQTRSSRRLDGSSERTERACLLVQRKGKGSPKGESEWEGESDEEGMFAEKKSKAVQAGPSESPYVYSEAKKVVPIESIYARRSPRIAFPTQPESARAPKKVSPEWRPGGRGTTRAKGRDVGLRAGAIIVDLSCSSEEEALNETAVEKTASAAGAKLVAMTAVDTERVVGSLGASEEDARCKDLGGLQRGEVAARPVEGVAPGEEETVGKSQGEKRGQGQDSREVGGR
jgi:hypothetical protein